VPVHNTIQYIRRPHFPTVQYPLFLFPPPFFSMLAQRFPNWNTQSEKRHSSGVSVDVIYSLQDDSDSGC